MYCEEDLIEAKGWAGKGILMTAIPGTLLLIGIVISLVLRIELLTIVLSIFLGVLLILMIELLIKPARDYASYIDRMLHGRTHEISVRFDTAQDSIDMFDGVPCHAVKVTDDSSEKPSQILFYLDARKKIPDLNEGDRVDIIYHDRAIASILKK